jgi:anthranilate/para-aminobenzoate synthase component I
MSYRLSEPGPALTPAEALRRIADDATIVMLHGCGLGWTHLAWGLEELSFTDCTQLPAPAQISTHGCHRVPGAWNAFPGGAFVQFDYEFPATAARRWPMHAWASWDPVGCCTLFANDRAGIEHLREGLARPDREWPRPVLASPLKPAWNGDAHAERVERIRDLIAAGDIYQANLTLPFTASLAESVHADIAAFLTLVDQSPAPHAAFFRSRDRSIISHSPECLLRCHGGQLVSEPIKGTRRRLAGREEYARRELLASAKDRAELAMIVDLMRNDLGRVAEPGSVAVAEPAVVMDLPYVHHLVAQVTARLRAGLSYRDAIPAVFPAGSITGAPKIRAMQIIRDLENEGRGPYCGSFGWLGDDGDCELAVAIRTLVLAGRQIRLHAGSGIVADSSGTAEWDEVRAKAAAMATALGGSV